MPHPKPPRTSAGFGLGLRTPHYADFLATPQPLDWLEIITDNFLVDGGKPLAMLERIRRDYPMAMHGVAMSIGAAGGIDTAYLSKVKTLADRIQPMWVSDHLCWIGPGPEQLHDLYPLPYTDEAARHVIEQIRRAQDILQRRLVLENVSSYVAFGHNAASEWQFLSHIANAADCLLLVDVNNVYVSSVNHGFDPLDYLNGLPPERVQQMHLAGHADHGDHIVDTHDHPVAPAVWTLYEAACQRFGAVATMIERDDDIPPLATLLDELAVARDIAQQVARADYAANVPILANRFALPPWKLDSAAPTLQTVQAQWSAYILDRDDAHSSSALTGASPQRLGIYHHAYRARLAEVLADSFAKTALYMGTDTFAEQAQIFAVQFPPRTRSLGRYGEGFPTFLAHSFPNNPELHELAQLDWDLRTRFDSADAPALDAAAVQAADPAQEHNWLTWTQPLHPSLLLRNVTSNVVQIWRAIDDDTDVPEVQLLHAPKTLAIWRKGQQPHFQTLDADEAAFIRHLQAGSSIESAANTLAGTARLPDPGRLAGWLQAWLRDGLLGQPHVMEHTERQSL
jgi:uncharacterized protein (UPF0276 family)